MEEEYRIFKALNHPLRIKILKIIAKKGYASYKELAKIEPKSGVLYHHLKLLGDLIYQDENKLYRLTEKGWAVIEFLDNEFFEYEDKGLNKILTPRPLFELVEGKKFLFLIVFSILASLLLQNSNFTLLGLFISPSPKEIPPYLIYLASLGMTYALPPIMKDLFFGKTYFRKYKLLDHASRASLVYLIILPFLLLLSVLRNFTLMIIDYFITQIFLILYITAEISVSFRIPLRKAFVITLLLHYIGLAIYVVLFLI